LLPAIFNAGEDGAAVAGEELGLVEAGGVFDDAGGGGVAFVGEVAGFEEPGDPGGMALAEAEADESIGLGGEGVAEIDVGFFW
jgi:hypothetical protein